MTYREIIERVKEAKNGAYSDKQMLLWLGALEGRIAADVFLLGIEEIRALRPVWPESLDNETLVSFPHDDIYDTWLEARIYAANGEYSEYQNAIEYHNEHFSNFVRWFSRVYRPAQGGQGVYQRREDMPVYYLTAYGLAVKQGYDGSLEQWLESLRGPQGEPGKSAYQYALEGGWSGTEAQFTEHMVANGKTAYAYALEGGYTGSQAEFAAKLAQESLTREQMVEYAQPKGDYLTQERMEEYAQPKGDYLTQERMEEYAQPKGDYLTEAPVKSVNGKTGAVKLAAADVGALPETGGAVNGPLTLGGNLILTEGVNLFASEADLPADAPEGALYWVLPEEAEA